MSMYNPASDPGLPRSVHVHIIIMHRWQTFKEWGRPERNHHVRIDMGLILDMAYNFIHPFLAVSGREE